MHARVTHGKICDVIHACKLMKTLTRQQLPDINQSYDLMRTADVAWELSLNPAIWRLHQRSCSGILRAGSSGTDPKSPCLRYLTIT